MSERASPEGKVVSAVEFNLKDDMIAVCGPILVTDNRESWLRRGARRVGISYRQAKSLFYSETDESAAVRVARAAARLRQQEAEARAEFRAAVRVVETFQRGVAAFDEDVAGEMARAALGQSGGAGAPGRTVDRTLK